MIDHLDLCSGLGGFALGFERTGEIRTRAFCEKDEFARRILAKHWPDVPCFPDLATLSWRDVGFRPRIVSAGFPCQDISIAGKGAGLDGARSALWWQVRRIVREFCHHGAQPDYVVLENVPALRTRGLDRVLGGLAALGYDAEWHCIPAAALGAPHRRDRIWIVAHVPDADCRGRRKQRHVGGEVGDAETGQFGDVRTCVADAGGEGLPQPERGPLLGTGWWEERGAVAEHSGWAVEPDVGRVVDGPASRLDRRKRLIALGNAVVPQIPEILGAAIARDFYRYV